MAAGSLKTLMARMDTTPPELLPWQWAVAWCGKPLGHEWARRPCYVRLISMGPKEFGSPR
jgi:hypothetical protein